MVGSLASTARAAVRRPNIVGTSAAVTPMSKSCSGRRKTTSTRLDSSSSASRSSNAPPRISWLNRRRPRKAAAVRAIDRSVRPGWLSLRKNQTPLATRVLSRCESCDWKMPPSAAASKCFGRSCRALLSLGRSRCWKASTRRCYSLSAFKTIERSRSSLVPIRRLPKSGSLRV